MLLCFLLSKTSGYVKRFNNAKRMYLLTKDKQLSDKYHRTWDKYSSPLQKECDIQLVCNEKYLKIK